MLNEPLFFSSNSSLKALHLLNHPFYMDWMEGRLSRETLKDYAQQYHAHVSSFPRFLSALHSICENEVARRILVENLADEEGITHGGIAHPELWMRFAEGVGATREEVRAAPARAGIQNVIDTFSRFAKASVAEGLGALYAYESQIPEIAVSKIQGLRKHYGIEDKRTLEFFEVHREADIYHRESLAKLITGLSEIEQRQAEHAGKEAAKALWHFLTDIHAVSA
jgi:pyrroloquinoline-quinone synthase